MFFHTLYDVVSVTHAALRGREKLNRFPMGSLHAVFFQGICVAATIGLEDELGLDPFSLPLECFEQPVRTSVEGDLLVVLFPVALESESCAQCLGDDNPAIFRADVG